MNIECNQYIQFSGVNLYVGSEEYCSFSFSNISSSSLNCYSLLNEGCFSVLLGNEAVHGYNCSTDDELLYFNYK